MRIRYVSTLYPPSIGGAQLQLHCLAKALQAQGDDVAAVCLSDRNRTDWLRLATVLPDPPGSYSYEGIPVTRVGYPPLARLRMLPWAASYYGMVGLAARRLATLAAPAVAEELGPPPDLVHVSRIGREFIAGAALHYARAHGIPYVLTPNHHPRWRGWRYVEYDRLYRAADALIVYTPAEHDIVVRDIGVDPERVYVTGVGPLVDDDYDADAFRAEHGLTRDFVLFLGQQYEYKGIDALLRAAEQVWARHSDVDFVFIGPPTPWSQERFAQVDDPRIRNLGRVSPADKAAALASCRLMCMPSNQESFGGVYLEAWHFGKAVIGGDIPAIRCVIDDGINGYVAPQEPAALAARLLTLLDDPAHAAALGAAGREKLHAEFSWARIAEKARAAYAAILARQRGGVASR